MKHNYQTPVIDISGLCVSDVLRISLDTPEIRDDIFGEELIWED